MGFVGVGHAAVCTSEDVMKGKEHTRRWGGGRQGWQLLTHLYGLEKHIPVVSTDADTQIKV